MASLSIASERSNHVVAELSVISMKILRKPLHSAGKTLLDWYCTLPLRSSRCSQFRRHPIPLLLPIPATRIDKHHRAGVHMPSVEQVVRRSYQQDDDEHDRRPVETRARRQKRCVSVISVRCSNARATRRLGRFLRCDRRGDGPEGEEEQREDEG